MEPVRTSIERNMRIMLRRDSEANWINADPVLLSGEAAFSTDKNKLKIGDGALTWSKLKYLSGSAYDIWLGEGNTGDEQDFLDSLKGEGVPAGGTEGQVLAKIDDVDYNTEWVTLPASEEFNVKDYGAVGDGVTVDTVAFNETFDAAVAAVTNGGRATVRIPAGLYLVNKITVTIPGPTDAIQAISIVGEGMHTSQLVTGKSNNTGILHLTSSGNTEIWEVKNLGFLSPLEPGDGVTNGTALLIESNLGPGDTGFSVGSVPQVNVQNVYFGGIGDTASEINGVNGFFGRALAIENKWFPNIFNCYFHTAENSTQDYGVNRSAIDLNNCNSPEINQCYIKGPWFYGIRHNNPDASAAVAGVEDFRFNNNFIIGQRYGILVDHPNIANVIEPGGTIRGNHIHGKEKSIFIRRHKNVIVTDNYIIVPDDASLFGIRLYIAVHIDTANDLTIANNQLVGSGFYNSSSYCTVGLYFTGTVEGVHGTNNLHNHGGIGFAFNHQCSQNSLPDFVDSRIGTGSGWVGLEKLVVAVQEDSLYSLSVDNGKVRQRYTNNIFDTIKIRENYDVYLSNTQDLWTHAESKGLIVEGDPNNSYHKLWIRDNGNAVHMELKPRVLELPENYTFAIDDAVGISNTIAVGTGTLTVTGGIITQFTAGGGGGTGNGGGGVPAGGTTGQVLAKVNNTDYNTQWVDPAADGADGDDGDSAYDIWLGQGNTGTEQDFLDSLNGTDGDDGEGVPTGGTTGQVLAKVNNTDYNTQWVDPATGGGEGVPEGGTTGQVLAKVNNDDYNTQWVTPSTGSGTALSTRNSVTVRTASIDDAAADDLNITIRKTCLCYSIETDRAAWITLYATAESRTADASRAETADPTPGSGVLAELITSGADTVLLTPSTILFNGDSTPIDRIYAKVVNKSGSAGRVSVTLTYLDLEA